MHIQHIYSQPASGMKAKKNKKKKNRHAPIAISWASERRTALKCLQSGHPNPKAEAESGLIDTIEQRLQNEIF